MACLVSRLPVPLCQIRCLTRQVLVLSNVQGVCISERSKTGRVGGHRVKQQPDRVESTSLNLSRGSNSVADRGRHSRQLGTHAKRSNYPEVCGIIARKQAAKDMSRKEARVHIARRNFDASPEQRGPSDLSAVGFAVIRTVTSVHPS